MSYRQLVEKLPGWETMTEAAINAGDGGPFEIQTNLLP